MVVTCVACKSKAYRCSEIKFHRFPLNRPKILRRWMVALKKKKWTPTVDSRLCSKHFTNNCYVDIENNPGKKQLLKNAVPSKFNFPEERARRRRSTKKQVVGLQVLLKDTKPQLPTLSEMSQPCTSSLDPIDNHWERYGPTGWQAGKEGGEMVQSATDVKFNSGVSEADIEQMVGLQVLLHDIKPQLPTLSEMSRPCTSSLDPIDNHWERYGPTVWQAGKEGGEMVQSATDVKFNSGVSETDIEVELEGNNEGPSKRPAATLTSERNKRTKKGVEAQREYMINTALNVLQKPEDEFDIVGKTVATKLRKMSGLQKVYAEKLINDVLYKGVLEQLSESSFIGDYHPYRTPKNRNHSDMSNASNSSNEGFNQFGR